MVHKKLNKVPWLLLFRKMANVHILSRIHVQVMVEDKW